MKKLFVIPIEQNFIETFTDRFLSDEGIDLSRTAVVFPGKRAFLYLNRLLAGKRNGPFFPPAEMTITEFITRITRRHFPDHVQIRKLDAVRMIHEIVKDIRPGLAGRTGPAAGFREFYPWAVKLLEFIDLMDREDIPESRLKNIKANAEIGYDVPEAVNLLLSRIIPIRREFHERLSSAKLLTNGLIYQLAGQYLEKTLFDEFDIVCFAGLFALTG
ncbi:MAG: hypothetical protein PHF84_12995, partial [bacterium]|nr:hypothetical protein [bacterium]